LARGDAGQTVTWEEMPPIFCGTVTSMDVIKTCEYFYHSVHIPVGIFNADCTLDTCFPELAVNPVSEWNVLELLDSSGSRMVVLESWAHTYNGCVRTGSGQYLVIGPVQDVRNNDALAAVLAAEYELDADRIRAFKQFLADIPACSSERLCNHLMLLDHMVNGTLPVRSEIEKITFSKPSETSIPAFYKNFVSPLEGEVKQDYEREKECLGYITSGSVSALRKRIAEKPLEKPLTLTDPESEDLDRLRTAAAMDIELFARAGIRGGLAPSLVLSCAESFIGEVQSAGDLEEIMTIHQRAAVVITEMVSREEQPRDLSPEIRETMQHVREDLYQSPTVVTLAEKMHYSSAYLSRKFKAETGLSLSDYIRKCRMEESRTLLTYSDLGLSEISDLLGFSSQSHFQNLFKKEFGITPHQFRQGRRSELEESPADPEP